MVLEVYIWGPAFGLPSIEPQSLATVAYLSQCLPPSEWRLIPSSDPSAGPTSR
jgi:sorting and assembly machinery component 37